MEDSKEFVIESELPSKQVSSPAISVADDVGKTDSNPFLDPKVAEHYRQIYEDAKYECRHVFDPSLEWTAEEEKNVVRKLDWRVSLWACVMFFALNVDRKNIGQAVSDNMLDQLNLTTNDYNYGTRIEGH